MAAKEAGDARRLRALLLIAAYALLCGVPVWWRTTSVPRPPLPHARMRALGGRLAAHPAAAALPVRLDVHVLSLQGDAAALDAQVLADEVERLVVREQQHGAGPARLDVAVSVWRPGGGGGVGGGCAQSPGATAAAAAAVAPCLGGLPGGGRLRELLEASSSSPDAAAETDALLLETLGVAGGGVAGRYALVVAVAPPRRKQQTPPPPPPLPPPPGAAGPPVVLTVGKHRHAWVALPGELREQPRALPAAVAEAAALALKHAFGLWAAAAAAAAGGGGGGGKAGDAPPPDLAALPLFSPGGLVLSFSLVNGDGPAAPDAGDDGPCAGGYAWDFAALERARLAPVVRALRGAAGGGRATVGAESAVLQLAPAGAEGAWRELGPAGAEGQEDEEEEEEEDEEEEEEDEDGGDGAADKVPKPKLPRRAGAYVLSREQLPSFVDSEWPFESGRGVLSSAATMHRAAQRRRRRRGRGARAAGSKSSGGGDNVRQQEQRRWARERDRSAALLAPHVLHFVTYVPPPGQRPLLVEGAAAAAERRAAAAAGQEGRRSGTALSSSSTASVLDGVDPAVNGYWIPSWGGVFIWNPPSAAQNSSSGDHHHPPHHHPHRRTPPRPRVCALPDDASAAAARAFVTHLRALLGLPRHGTTRPASQPGAATIITAVRLLPSPERGLAAWESDALSRARARVGVASAARTLRGLSEVVSELPNLGMPPLIGAQVGAALAAADAALEGCARGDYGSAAVASGAAASAADAAYLHPSVLSQLNFPDSHKLGVYMPYFLPASVPLVQGLVREARRFWRRRRRRRQTQGRRGVEAAAAGAAAAAAGAAAVVGGAAAAGAAAGGSAAASTTRRSKRPPAQTADE